MGIVPASKASVNIRAAFQGAAKSVSDGEKTRDEGGDKILASPCTDNCIVSTRNCWSVVRRDHQAHFEELAGVGGKPALEPEQAKDPTNAHVLSKHLGDGDAGIQELLSALVADAAHEAGWLPDQPKLTCPVVIHWHWRWGHLRLWNNNSLHDQVGIHPRNCLSQFIK